MSQYKQPPYLLTVDVDSDAQRTELLFFPFDPQTSFVPLSKSGGSAPVAPKGNAVGFLHAGGVATYQVGSSLALMNGLQPQSIRGHHQRRHGECELEVSWKTLLDAVLAGVDDSSGEGECNALFCPDYDVHYTKRVATSYLRQVGTRGQGGFGMFFEGETEFDSPVIDDLSFYGKAAYDLRLSEAGLPELVVAAGPFSGTWNCSSSPFATCPREDVEDSVIEGMAEATGKLNGIFEECLFAPIEADCETAVDCADDIQVVFLASGARQEAEQRGMTLAIAAQFESALLDSANWRCAPVTNTCAALTGADPTPEPTCQLRLAATDVVSMPDRFGLVWYPEDPGAEPVTAAQGLYLGLSFLGQTDELLQLCSPRPATRARSFVRVVDNSSH
jgi:hypothetical protein